MKTFVMMEKRPLLDQEDDKRGLSGVDVHQRCCVTIYSSTFDLSPHPAAVPSLGGRAVIRGWVRGCAGAVLPCNVCHINRLPVSSNNSGSVSLYEEQE